MYSTVGLFCVEMEAVSSVSSCFARNRNQVRPAFEVSFKQLSSPI